MSYPSIFNDVLGPVMRGPSSSHCAASLRIGRLCLDMMDGQISKVEISFDPEGSLATTHEAQGSDMGLFGGFLGWEADDERLEKASEHIATAGIEIDIKITELKEKHPNTYKLNLYNQHEQRELIAISTGGGMIEVIEIDGAKVEMDGGFYETLIYCRAPDQVMSYLKNNIICEDIEVHKGTEDTFIEVKAQVPIDETYINELKGFSDVLFLSLIHISEPTRPY